MIPSQKIVVTHAGLDKELQDKTLTSDVWLRENKGSNATFTVADTAGATFLNDIGIGDVVQVSFKKDYGDSWKQVFGGYATELAPSIELPSGQLLPYKVFGYDIGLDRMRAAIEYGVESVNPTIDTLLEMLTNVDVGLLPKWAHKVLNSDVDSGYTFNSTYILNEATSHKYLLFPYTPINDCLKTILDLIAAAKYPNAGLHWIVIPESTIAYLCIDQVNNHTTATTKWPTNCPVTLTEGQNIDSQKYTVLERDANYIVYFGKYEYPTGEIATENAAANWTYYVGAGATKENSIDRKVGANSVHFNLLEVGASEHAWWYPLDSLNAEKFGTKRTVPTLTFYLKHVNLLWAKVRLGTGLPADNNYYIKTFTDKLPTSGKWGALELSLGAYIKNEEEDWDKVGVGDWKDLDYIAINLYRPATGQSDFYFDNLLFNGIVTRGAYKSGTGKYKIKLITDSLAKTANLVAIEDSGTVAQLAKAELIRAVTTPKVGTIKLGTLEPTIQPGQIITSLTPNMRITEVHFHFGVDGGWTELQVTDDLKNSYPLEPADNRSPTAFYNSIMKATNPDFQDRDRGNLKGREIDIDQPILAKNYA